MGGDQVFVKNSDSQKVGSFAALEGGAHLNEPVNHFGSEVGGYIMALQGVIHSSHRQLFRHWLAVR